MYHIFMFRSNFLWFEHFLKIFSIGRQGKLSSTAKFGNLKYKNAAKIYICFSTICLMSMSIWLTTDYVIRIGCLFILWQPIVSNSIVSIIFKEWHFENRENIKKQQNPKTTKFYNSVVFAYLFFALDKVIYGQQRAVDTFTSRCIHSRK